MNKNQILTQELNKIYKSNNEKKRKCIVDNCQNTAINSHILQKNGIISLICENRHFYILDSINFFNIQAIFETPFQFRKIGINEGLSFPLFCNIHDVNLFNDIEVGEYDPNLYKTQLLFAYRSICNEIRKKEIVIDKYKSIFKNQTIQFEFTIEKLKKILNLFIEENNLGIIDLKFFQKEIESELDGLTSNNPTHKKFSITTLTTNKLDICMSSNFTLMNQNTDYFQKEPLNTIFISIFPKEDSTIIICGYHNNFSDNWITEYTNSWINLNQKEIQERISDILINRCETWGISPSLYNSISNEKRKNIVNKFSKSLAYFNEDLDSEINIFKN